jgi:hypothetical protein
VLSYENKNRKEEKGSQEGCGAEAEGQEGCGVMPDRFGRYTPPKSDGLPRAGKHILAKVYSAARRIYSGEIRANKARSARIAWGAVKGAGYHKIGGKWKLKR